MAKTIKIGGRLESVETGNIVAGANQIIDDAKNKRQSVINGEVDAELVRLDETKQGNLTFDNAPTEDSNNPVKSGGVYAADKLLSDAIEAILLLIPSAASALNKLVDMQTMNSSIATATATFRGTYNVVSDLELAYNATHEQIAAKLAEVITTADNNDYAFVQISVSATSQDIAKTERYKFNGEAWAYEYDLNNSGFTQAQWDAINSTITAALVSKLTDLPTATDLQTALNGKQDNLTFDQTPTSGSQNPVTSGGIYSRNAEIVALITALDTAKQDKLTFDSTPTQNSSNPVTSNGVYVAVSALQAAIVALDAAKQNVLTFDSTPTLGSNNPVTSSGIKTEANRLNGLINDNAAAIVTLNNLYQALTQSALVVVAPTDTWPVSNPNTTTIYRVVDRVNTPPQYYSDYMWNGTSMVQMAQYNNAIDNVPTAGSNNLVKSGGVFMAIEKSGIIADNELSGADCLDISDDEGNVAMRVEGGEIETKHFNTRETPSICESNDGFNITDDQGNVILRLKNGHIQTKKFNSRSFWEGKRIAFLGDSITSHAEYVNAYVALTGCVALNYGVSTSHLVKCTGKDNSFEERYSAMTDDADMVVVFGGTNDFGDPTFWTPWGDPTDGTDASKMTFYAGLFKLFSGLKQKYLGKPIVIVTPLHHGVEIDNPEYVLGSDGSITLAPNPFTNKTMPEYVEAIKYVASIYSLNVLDAYSQSYLQPIEEMGDGNRHYFADGLHLSQLGGDKLAKWLYPQLEEIYKMFYV